MYGMYRKGTGPDCVVWFELALSTDQWQTTRGHDNVLSCSVNSIKFRDKDSHRSEKEPAPQKELPRNGLSVHKFREALGSNIRHVTRRFRICL
jgi:hypothetical protein